MHRLGEKDFHGGGCRGRSAQWRAALFEKGATDECCYRRHRTNG